MHICTIIASNYLRRSRGCSRARSGSTIPSGTCWTLVIDDHDGEIDPADEPFEVVTPARSGHRALRPDGRAVQRAGALHRGQAVAAAPPANERGVERDHLPRPRHPGATTRSRRWTDCCASTRRSSPRTSPRPMPRDGRKPSETDILIAGSFNLGFVGLAAGAETDWLLDWWAERLETDCRVAPERGYFVDQRWMDFAPGLVPPRRSCATPATTSPTGTCRARRSRSATATATGGRRAAALLPLQRLRPEHAGPALQAPGPRPAWPTTRAGASCAALRGRAARPPATTSAPALALRLRTRCRDGTRSTTRARASTARR